MRLAVELPLQGSVVGSGEGAVGVHAAEALFVVSHVLNARLLQWVHRLGADLALVLRAAKLESQGTGSRPLLLSRFGNRRGSDTLRWRRVLLLRLDGALEASRVASRLLEQLLVVGLAVGHTLDGGVALQVNGRLAVRASEARLVVDAPFHAELFHGVHRLRADLALALRADERHGGQTTRMRLRGRGRSSGRGPRTSAGRDRVGEVIGRKEERLVERNSVS